MKYLIKYIITFSEQQQYSPFTARFNGTCNNAMLYVSSSAYLPSVLLQFAYSYTEYVRRAGLWRNLFIEKGS